MATAITSTQLLTDAKGRVAVVGGLAVPFGRWPRADVFRVDHVSADVKVTAIESMPFLLNHHEDQVLGYLDANGRLLRRPDGYYAELFLPDTQLGERVLRGVQLGLWERAELGDVSTRDPEMLRGWSMVYRAGETDGQIDYLEIHEISLATFPKRFRRATALTLSWQPAERWMPKLCSEKELLCQS